MGGARQRRWHAARVGTIITVMNDRVKQILEDTLTLSREESAELAVELATSVDGEPDADAQTAWAAEIERRARRAIAGESRGVAWPAVRARIERSLRRE